MAVQPGLCRTWSIFYQVITRDQYVCMLLICLLVKAIRTIREMITKTISAQRWQPGAFILQALPNIKIVSCCRVYTQNIQHPLFKAQYFKSLWYATLQCHFIDIIVTCTYGKQFTECYVYDSLIPMNKFSVYLHSFLFTDYNCSTNCFVVHIS